MENLKISNRRFRILMRLINQQICKMKVINSKMPDSQSLRKVKHFRKSNKKKLVLSKIKVKHYKQIKKKRRKEQLQTVQDTKRETKAI